MTASKVRAVSLKEKAAALNQPNRYPLRQWLDEKAAGEEIQGLVQFSFFRPHLAELLQACAQARVDVLVLKGAALAEILYPRPSLRPFGDLDLLVRAADTAQARTVLETLGYVVDPAQWDDLVRERDCQANFFKHTPRGPVVVELHTRLVNNNLFFPQSSSETEGPWERARPATLAGVPTRVLGPEDQILHLCLHLAGHYLAAPQSLQDIVQVCEHAQSGALPMDWPLFLRLAGQEQAVTACFCGMYVAKWLLGAPVPDDVVEALSPGPQRQRLEALAAARALDLEQTHTEHLRLPLLWHLLGSSRMRLSAARRILFPSQRWLVLHYYYDLFDAPDAPRPPQGWWPNPLTAAQDAIRFLGTFLILYGVHGWSLARRGGAITLRRLRR